MDGLRRLGLSYVWWKKLKTGQGGGLPLRACCSLILRIGKHVMKECSDCAPYVTLVNGIQRNDGKQICGGSPLQQETDP